MQLMVNNFVFFVNLLDFPVETPLPAYLGRWVSFSPVLYRPFLR